MYTIIETPKFVELAAAVWSESERLAFIGWLANNPLAGDVIVGSGGCEKYVGVDKVSESEVGCA